MCVESGCSAAERHSGQSAFHSAPCCACVRSAWLNGSLPSSLNLLFTAIVPGAGWGGIPRAPHIPRESHPHCPHSGGIPPPGPETSAPRSYQWGHYGPSQAPDLPCGSHDSSRVTFIHQHSCIAASDWLVPSLCEKHDQWQASGCSGAMCRCGPLSPTLLNVALNLDGCGPQPC